MRTVITLAISLIAGSASASCIGTALLSSCTDASGNNYTVQRLGDSTYVNGSNAETGTTWSQNSQRLGNTTFTNGNNHSSGTAWSSTTQTLGNTTFTNGTDSDGNSWQTTCTNGLCN